MVQTCDPMHARAWLNWREPINWAVSVAVMAVVFLFLMLVAPVWLAFASALLASFLLFFFVLDKRVIVIVCPHCNGHIETDTPWRCGFCEAENSDTENYPFLGRCSNKDCRAKPKGYECHHCREPLFFTNDRQKAGIARCAVIPARTGPKRVKKDRHAEELDTTQKSIDLKTKKVREAELEIELRGLKQNLEPQKGVRERLRQKVGSRGELDAEVRKMKAEANAEFKDDHDERERQHRLIDDEARDLLE